MRNNKVLSAKFDKAFDNAYSSIVSKRIERTFDCYTEWSGRRIVERLDYANCMASQAVGIPPSVKAFQKGD